MSLWSSKKAPSDCEAQCPDCGVILSRLADMNRHRKTKHPDGTEPKFPCPWMGCGYMATQKGNLKSHVDARHSNGPKYPCPECGRRFTDAAARIRHRKRMHGYVPYHTKEYLARHALNRKERVVQGASKAVSNESRLQQVARVVPGLTNASSSVPPPAPKLPEVVHHDDFVGITHLYPLQQTWPGYDTPNASSSVSPPAPKLLEVAHHDPVDITHLYLPQRSWPGYDTLNASSSVSPPAPKLPEVTYHDPFDITHLYPLQQPWSGYDAPNTSPSVSPPAPKLLEVAPHDPVDITHLCPPQQSWPGYDTFNASSSVSPSVPKLPELAYHAPVDIAQLYPTQPTWSGYDTPNASESSSVPPPVPKHPEVAYHDNSWKVPADITQLYPPQQTLPGYDTPSAIQYSPSVAQSPPSPTPSDFTLAIDYYSDLHGPQLYTMGSQEQQFGESITGDHGMPPYNGNGSWNWPLQQ